MTEQDSESGHKTRRRRGLSTAILIALVLGIACGLFVGEPCRHLQFIGEAYVALLQMTVLPYIVLALIANIGGLTFQQSRSLASAAGIVLVGLWALGLVFVAVLSLSFPPLPVASFFSTSMIEPAAQPDYISLYIPANPFRSLASSLVPAVVVFSIAVGLALIGIPNKQGLLKPMLILIAALSRVNKYVVRLAPIGIFGMVAAVAGTWTLEEVGRLQGYFITITFAALFLSFWVLPALINTLTPLRARDVIRISRDALVTAFAVKSVFVVLPMLIQNVKDLFEESELMTNDTATTIDATMPVAYTFPNLGKLVMLIFVPFAAWFTGQSMTFGQYPGFLVSGLFAFFARGSVAIPFLLDQVRLPVDLYHLYQVAGLFCGRLGTLLTAMSLLAFTAITTCAMTGRLRVRRGRLFGYAGLTTIMVAGMVFSTRWYLERAMSGAYQKSQIIASMHSIDNPAPADILDLPAPNPAPLRPGQSRLGRMRERGVLRVGFLPDQLPFTFFNTQGDLVGFGVEMAYRLAHDLELAIEFVPITPGRMMQQMDRDDFDFVVSAMPGSVKLYERTRVSRPYLELRPALSVRDHRRQEFASRSDVLEMDQLRIGLVGNVYMKEAVHEWLPNASIVSISSPRAFFEEQHSDLDALVTAAEVGSAWSLLYPDYTVVLSLTEVATVPVVLPIAGRDATLGAFLDNWIDLRKTDGTLQSLYDRWILGLHSKEREPRWSVIRDVLGWVE